MTYVTLQEFQNYVDVYTLDTDDYDVSPPEKRNKALLIATRTIDRLNFLGNVAVLGQELQFPRGTDVTVPTAIKNATCELALTFLAGTDINRGVNRQNVSHEAFLGVKVARDTNAVQEHLMNGIPNFEAWLLLRPYLRPVSFAILRG